MTALDIETKRRELKTRLARAAIKLREGTDAESDAALADIIEIVNEAIIIGAEPVATGEAARNIRIFDQYKQGVKVTALAARYSLSVQRIRQIIGRAEREEGKLAAWRQVVADRAMNLGDIPLEALDLTQRVRNCLRLQECETVGDVLQWTDADLLRMPNFGRISLLEWKQCLRQLREMRAAP